MDCIIYVTKTKALISFAVTAKLICVFVIANAKKPGFSRRGSYLFVILIVSQFGFEGGALVLIAPVSGHCLPFTFRFS